MIVPGAALIALVVAAAAAVAGVLAAWWTRSATTLSARNFYLLVPVALTLAVGGALVDVRSLAVAGPLLVGVLFAGAFGRRWRRSDLGAGDELREHERSRRWFWQTATREEGTRVRLGEQGELQRLTPWPADQPYVPLTAEDEEHERVPIGDGRHVLLVGATGSGKTTTALRIAAMRALTADTALLCLDPKGDRPTEATLRSLAAVTGRQFIVFDPRDPASDRWMPLWGDRPAETVARLVAGIQTSEPYYHDVLRQHLTIVTRVLHAAGHWPVSFPFVASAAQLVEFPRLLHLARTSLPPEHAELLRATERHAVTLSTKEGRSGVIGGLTRLALVVDAWREVLTPRELPDGRTVGVAMPDAMRDGAIVLWRTHVDAMPDAAAAMTALALGDVAAAAQYANAQWTLLADEAGPVMQMAENAVLALLQRGRSYEGQVLLATQSVADFASATGNRDLLDSLADNFAAVLAHRQTAPDSRDWLARMMGTRALWQSTDQTIRSGSLTGAGSRRRVHAFKIPADTFARLGRGQAVNWNTLGPEPAIVQVLALTLDVVDDVEPMPRDEAGPGEIAVVGTEPLPPTPAELEDLTAPAQRPEPPSVGEGAVGRPGRRRPKADDI